MAEEIIIISGNKNDGKLTLSDGGHSKVKRGVNIIWKVKKGSNVDCVEDIKIKHCSDEIFSIYPTMQDCSKWKAKIKEDALDYAECEYAIHWKADDNTKHIHDPKISVRPKVRFDILVKAILSILTAILSLFTLKFLFSKRSKR